MRESFEYILLLLSPEVGIGSTVAEWLKVWTLVSHGLVYVTALPTYSLCDFGKIRRQGDVGGKIKREVWFLAHVLTLILPGQIRVDT